jgi:hypothetical protein
VEVTKVAAAVDIAVEGEVEDAFKARVGTEVE